MKRPLIAGVRPAGETLYRMLVFGRADNRFPPARLEASLRGLAQWISHGSIVPARERSDAAPTLRLI